MQGGLFLGKEYDTDAVRAMCHFLFDRFRFVYSWTPGVGMNER